MDLVESRLTLEGFTQEPGELIPLLQHFQQKYGYISQENVSEIANFLKVSENYIYGVASFYAQFRFRKPGDHTIRVCLGTACHVQGGGRLAEEVHKKLGLRTGQVTPDQRFEYEEVACLGCCAQASVLEVDGKIYAKMTPDRFDEVLKKHDTL